MIRFLTIAAALALSTMSIPAQLPTPPVDLTAIGPQVGTKVPGFSGPDQFGRTHTLESSLGPKGAMLVFFRSADW